MSTQERTTSSFRVRLRRPAAEVPAESTASTSKDDKKITDKSDFLQPMSKVNAKAGNVQRQQQSSTSRNIRDLLQKTPTKPVSVISKLSTTGNLDSVTKNVSTYQTTEDFNTGGNLLTSNTSIQTTTTTTKQNNSMSATQISILHERIEIERKEKLLKESHAKLYSKFRNFRINEKQQQTQESSESSNDENEEPNETNDPDYSVEYLPSAKASQKVVRAFSADQSVVEILPDNASSFGEPSFVKGINNGILRLPYSHQLISSSRSYSDEVAEGIASQYSSSKAAKNPIPSGSTSKKRLPVSSSKKPLNDSSQRPWLKKFPAKESASKAGRVLRPLNLDSHMAAVASSVASTSSTFTNSESATLGNSSKSASSSFHKHTKLPNTSGSHQSIIDMEIDETEVFENNNPLKLARSMPTLNQAPEPVQLPPVTSKTSESCPPSAKKMPPPELPKSALGVAKLAAPALSLKSLKSLGPGVAKVPKLPEKPVSSSSAKPTPSKAISQPAVAPASSTKSKSAESTSTDQDLKTISINGRNYKVLNRLGTGGSAVVYQVFDLQKKISLALKTVDLSKADKAVVRGFQDEIKLLNQLRNCKRVVKMHDYEFRNNNRKLFIVMEKGDNDLAKVIHDFKCEGGVKKLSPHMIRFYWQEMLKVVNEIHENGVVHSDLKPVNFIIVSGKSF